MDKYELRELKEAEEVAKKFMLSIVGVCRKCGEHWTTMSEVKGIRRCQTCKTGKYMTNLFHLYEVTKALKKKGSS